MTLDLAAARGARRRVAVAALAAALLIPAFANAQRGIEGGPTETTHESPYRLVLEPSDGDPASPLAFGVAGLPPRILAAMADRAPAALSTGDEPSFWSVHVEHDGRPAILGRYRIAGGVLWLVPAFPAEPGVRYHAVFRPEALATHLGSGAPVDPRAEARIEPAVLAALARSRPVTADLVVEVRTRGDAARVATVHPAADEVPENLLRMYVHFTAAMSRGRARQFVRLESDDGGVIEHAFLELDEELWDRDGRRLTLLLDPGRIKLGLRPHEDEGLALRAGHQVVLIVDAGWPDAAGRPLAAPWRRAFRVGREDREPIDPSRWRVTSPEAGGREPLRAAFYEPLDHALLHRLLWVEDVAGAAVAGSIATRDAEREWSFVPAAPWAPGGYVLRVDRRLEDLAGNRIGRAFEVDLEAPPGTAAGDAARDEGTFDPDPVSLPFTVSP